MNRRTLLEGAGAVAVLAIGGAVWRAFDRGVFGGGSAFEPWTSWRGDPAEGPLTLVRAAILASNAVNCQPWLYRLSRSSIELFVDQRRNIGAFDPFMRELHISAGCALENLMLAAAAHGYRPSLTLFPGALAQIPRRPQPELVARVALITGAPIENDLYDAIPRRHTNRAPFDPSIPVPPPFLSELTRRTADDDQVKLFLFSSEADRMRISRWIADAGRVIASRPEIQAALAPSFHSNWHTVEQQRDGITFGNFGESALEAALEKLLPPAVLRRITAAPSISAYRDIMMTGRLFGLIAVRDRYDRAANVRAGRIWQRTHLLATARGLAARPANQSVELIDHERVWGKLQQQAALLAGVTGDASWQPTFMFYLGAPTRTPPPTPRRDVHDVLF